MKTTLTIAAIGAVVATAVGLAFGNINRSDVERPDPIPAFQHNHSHGMEQQQHFDPYSQLEQQQVQQLPELQQSVVEVPQTV